MLKIDPVTVFQDNDPRIVRARAQVPVSDPGADPVACVAVTVARGDRVTLPELDASVSVLDASDHARATIAHYRPGTRFCGETLTCAR
ncbi:MAG: hypothetical protein A2Z64_00755 [Betaproteobacteria bacterium RIFCSPLOWO2_02_67_12]|nr:MAG: hypothetical protein A2Z64_00755 [Betaproteobacteria bacterium RIFCSPLOWO2_02_67_12]OGA55287.1 MAG: hypothetical protein A3F77_14950 [Betaproteobacteria bacterium RIFCSPLOWO2_12_FULL_67_28]